MSNHTKRGTGRKFAAALAVALVASVLALATPAGAKQSVSTTRVSGADRYLTSTALSAAAALTASNGATHFVLVNGTSYADALSAAALAGAKSGSIILLPADGTISASATARMVAATNVTIVGGFSALPATVETTMKTLRPTATISRISGADRYSTAANVASNIVNTSGGSIAAVNGLKSVFLASGTSFADAVIAAPGAYAGPGNSAATAVVPIMLTATDSLSAATKAQMSVLGVKQAFVLGGTAAVSAATAAEVTALGISVVRLSGDNRYATAAAIADKFTAKTTAGGWGFDDDDIAIVNIEQSGGGADALAAAAYLGQAKAPALGAGASGLATETSTWLTAHNGATGVNKIHAIGGTAAVSAAQLTAADAAGTIAGPVATITAGNGQSSVVIAFSQTVTASSAGLSTGYSIFGPGTPPTVSTVTYSTTKNTVTLGLSGALQTTDVVRVNAGIIKTAAGLTVGQTDYTVGLDLVKPTCSLYAATGTAIIRITCDELVVQVGTLNTDVDSKITVGGATLTASAVGSDGATALSTASKTVTVTHNANFTATGAAIVVQKDILKDLAGNKVAALTGSVITDTTKPTVVGLPTYATTGLTPAVLRAGEATATVTYDTDTTVTAKTGGEQGNLIRITTVITDGTANPTCALSGSGTIASPWLITITGDGNGGNGTQTTDQLAINACNANAAVAAKVTFSLKTGSTSGNVTGAVAATALAGGKDAALVMTSAATGLASNGYELVITDNNTSGCVVTYAAATKTVTVAHDTGAADFCTPTAMKTAIDTHSDTKGLFNIAIVNNIRDLAAQDGSTAALGAFTGGTTRLTVTTNFSEAIAVGGTVDIEYDVAGDNSGQVDTASNTVVGSTLTSLWTLTGATHLTAPTGNVDTIHYDLAADGGITDLAGNVMVAAEKALATP